MIYYNTTVWLPYDQKSYELGKLYGEMAEIAAMNISIWGGAYTRKPVFATVRH
jgi:hypothetical protein